MMSKCRNQTSERARDARLLRFARNDGGYVVVNANRRHCEERAARRSNLRYARGRCVLAKRTRAGGSGGYGRCSPPSPTAFVRRRTSAVGEGGWQNEPKVFAGRAGA